MAAGPGGAADGGLFMARDMFEEAFTRGTGMGATIFNTPPVSC